MVQLTLFKIDEKTKTEKVIKSHYWKPNSDYALCGAGPRSWRGKFADGKHPDRLKYPRCPDCKWKHDQMGDK